MIVTHNHSEIKKWAEMHDGKPELIDHSDSKADAIGIRINFPGEANDLLLSEASPPKKIDWDEFFQIFDERGLSLEFDDSKSVKESGFNYRFINRED